MEKRVVSFSDFSVKIVFIEKIIKSVGKVICAFKDGFYLVGKGGIYNETI